MNNVINEIMAELFPGEDTAALAPRFEFLYGLMFRRARQEEWAQLKEEVLACERHRVRHTRNEVVTYGSVTQEMAVRMFSSVALTMAEIKLKSGKDLLCADYLGNVFSQFLNSGLLSAAIKKEYRMAISDALVDFNYASGFSDNLSFRLREKME